MTNKLLAELNKINDNLSIIEFNLNDVEFKFYYRYLTILEKMRIEQGCVKRVTTMAEDGSQTVTFDKQQHLFPIHLILEKALNKKGERLFSHVNKQDFKTISSLPHNLIEFIASEMQVDIFRNLESDNDR